ncbi:hypothetical protein PHYBLDRAFT_140961 [Phycomyces blakesleeanus NRRL 1555(-)]|uniref:Uncharacterized protein n=1 Tax=Phycomyces blakesleeanus (strain ATCC 8743b / DSM 1359 / FGSC 10004 / NBRC 33097 / NRRL 1555) TaxID=763407 RepID=A0A162UZ17_PHYB8|nr:hypothetical protein PHYBLDRAFT_140961 [Phycomyces blakesleeanus NRRL 1555(-)]OAD78902.1 hypothetical protein PHYBLDRAFT_140961 [Phycomyces blakesleeanus NRRL 1555(-)]|eukprot:XP_018296942.1 hypothetical protein PHYBLDRAFT_140961 [Phycomyces blakesleeanus NRRL 1555(-)]
MATPKKAVVFYSNSQANSTPSTQALDDLCTRGCSGQLIMEDLGGKEIVELAKSLGFAVSLALKSVPTSAEIIDILASVGPKVDLLLVDISTQNNSWPLINDVVKDLMADTPTYLKVIVAPRDESASEPVLADKNWWDSLVPEQSHVKKEGRCVSIEPRHGFVCSYLHDKSTRRDNATKFTTKDIIENGCNGKILAWHFLGEIGHKLGFVPKYGA